MIKKILIFSFLVLSLFAFNPVLSDYSACKQDWNIWDMKTTLQWCLDWSTVVQSNDLTVSGWFKTIILNFIKNVSIILALAAIWFIAYGSMVLVASWWNDEKIKKWKNIIKWSLVGFLWLVSASWIIALLVNLIYWL